MWKGDYKSKFNFWITIDEKEICIIPDYLTFEEATAVPLTALTTMQASTQLTISMEDS